MLSQVLTQALQVTVFVALMMIAVEHVNVLTRGAWARTLAASRSRQYLLAVLLEATSRRLGAFAVVALYSHRMVSFGALVAAMIATSGMVSGVRAAGQLWGASAVAAGRRGRSNSDAIASYSTGTMKTRSSSAPTKPPM